jgi:hypothetical protein
MCVYDCEYECGCLWVILRASVNTPAFIFIFTFLYFLFSIVFADVFVCA